MKILITGASGNLGSILAGHLIDATEHILRLMVHQRDVPANLKVPGRTESVHADLANPATLGPAVDDIDVIIHFAGVLFKSNPEEFLPITNTQYFRNLVDAACLRGVQKVILISFPHVEGASSFERPATGRIDGKPISAHATTRLEEERYLFSKVAQPISLRVGMVYGRGILMIDAARWLASHKLLGVWKEPTAIHLISVPDFCEACRAAIEKSEAHGTYHVGDEGKVYLQEFLSMACKQWGYSAPWTMPLWMIYLAADSCELYSKLFGTVSPLTRDFIDIGRVSYYGDTHSFRRDLVPVLKFPTIADGINTL